MSEPAVAVPHRSDYVSELEARLSGNSPSEPMTAADLLQALRPIAQALEEVRRQRDIVAETVKFVNELQERLMLVDTLPDTAPFGALIRLTSGGAGVRAPLYLGNGPGQPLSRLVPTAIP